jgi:virginiamycin A acetyltransferase
MDLKSALYSILLVPSYGGAVCFWLVYHIQRLFMPSRDAFSNQSQALAGIPGLRGMLLRQAFYRMTLQRCGKRVMVSYGTILSHPATEIGDYAYVGAYCTLGLVSIGNHAMLGSNVDIPSGKSIHGSERSDVPMQLQPGIVSRINIGADAWLGNGSLVLADVADHAIVGAGSVVTSAVATGAIMAGNPARILRYRQGFEPQPPETRQ